MYHMAPDQLDRYRQAVADDKTGEELERIISAIERQEIAVHGRDALKTAPRGYPADHPRVVLLRYKGLVTWKEWPVEPWLGTAAARQHVAGFLAASQPLCAWLAANVGESAAEPARRVSRPQGRPHSGHRPNSSTVCPTSVKPASAATCSAQRSTARPSTSTLLPQLRQVR